MGNPNPMNDPVMFASLFSLLNSVNPGGLPPRTYGKFGVEGMTQRPTMDALNRPIIPAPGGDGVSSTISGSWGFPEGEVLLPTVADDRKTRKKGQPQGHIMTPKQTMAGYLNGPNKGQHLGVFGPSRGKEDWQNADNYAGLMHGWQQAQLEMMLNMLVSRGL